MSGLDRFLEEGDWRRCPKCGQEIRPYLYELHRLNCDGSVPVPVSPAPPLPGDGWTYCHERQPAEPGTYEISRHRRGVPTYARESFWDGAGWTITHVYAWRSFQPAPLTEEALEYLQRQGVEP